MLCPAVLDPFEGPYYRIVAVCHQALLCPFLCKIYCIFIKIIKQPQQHIKEKTESNVETTSLSLSSRTETSSSSASEMTFNAVPLDTKNVLNDSYVINKQLNDNSIINHVNTLKKPLINGGNDCSIIQQNDSSSNSSSSTSSSINSNINYKKDLSKLINNDKID